eukprot:TRINITY_DN2420_c0_g1::TRINITY_DN2420_c0_g1_i1::g.8895::m.8895 TRINITY_DN2420_c0_g1::TRINITY_DN2420_c0_g1_i1::g.8895  ORF type:complete len:392 (+),score=148.86,sp/Q2U1F3/LAPA_ASPOR/44.24/1e-85,Peptidase_M28/PF04389.12/2.8e-31,Peptidase_M20/PF01546.23/0.045 TRINITY_DN2420_c0_g1_i1:54-1178(+)
MIGSVLKAAASLMLLGSALAVPIGQQTVKPEALTAPFEDARLISISDVIPPFWVPRTVAEHLGATDLQFMDITETHNLVAENAPERVEIPSTISHKDEVAQYLDDINKGRIETDLTFFSSFNNRYYKSDTGVESCNWLYETVGELASVRSDITVEQFTHSFPQKSLIARILPSNAAADASVIIGSHQDSIAQFMPNGKAPGADDDGSGSMTLLEVFRVLVEGGFKPKDYILEFHWYAAEEVGLLGSQDVAQAYQRDGAKVRGMLQMDMVGYDAGNSRVAVITDFTDANQNQFIRQLVDQYLSIPWIDSKCGYGCSDHASWTKAGYPSSFPFETEFSKINSEIHTPRDLVATINFDHAAEFGKLAVAFAVEMTYN